MQEISPVIIPTTPTTYSENAPTKYSEGVTIPTLEGERANTHTTPPPQVSKTSRTTVRQPIQTPQNPTQSEVSPPNLTMPNYITQESMNAIYIPTQTAPTKLQHFCSLVIHTITGESTTNYKKLARDP